MCSRYRLVKEKIILMIAGRKVELTLRRMRYNVGPRQPMPVLIPDASGSVKVVEMKWGWRAAWSKQLLINAQAETVQGKTAFSEHLHQRCLVPADGFYEWTADKTPIMFTRPGEEPICFAGLWLEAEAQPPEAAGKEHDFVILTTSPNDAVAKIHNRMPFIVQPRQYEWWFDNEQFRAVLDAPDRSPLESRPVQRDLNNVRNEGAELLKPPLVQPGLF